MKMQFHTLAVGFASLTAIAGLGVAITALKRNAGEGGRTAANPSPQRTLASAVPASAPGDNAALVARIAALEKALGTPPPEAGGSASGEGPQVALTDRLDAIEASLAKLSKAFDGISLEAASEERDALFRAENGYVKADEYFAAGKFAIAAEGYLTFLEEYPDHPEAYDILKRARQAFTRAGYHDKAVWAHKELLRNLGDQRGSQDVLRLAQLEKDAGSLDSAIKHANEAADLANEPQQRLWNRMYWAWYNQLRDGNEAGLTAYREVLAEIEAAGYTDEKLGVRAREKIAEIERVENTRTAAE